MNPLTARNRWSPSLLITLGALAVLPVNAADTVRRYGIYVESGARAGEQVVQRDEHGTTRVRFIFKDNGRGPEIDEQFRLAADGTLDSYQAKGSSTFGNSIDEKFTRKGTQASWQSPSERGNSKQAAGALYLPLGASLEWMNISLRALGKRGDAPLPLLPSGHLQQRVLTTLKLEQNGEQRDLQLIAQSGIGLTPNFIWATRPDTRADSRTTISNSTTAADPQLFAYVIPGYMTAIEEGWEAHRKQLSDVQRTAENTLLTTMAKSLQHPLPGLTVVRNARIFDSATATVGAASDIYILRGRITDIRPAGHSLDGADQALDAGGRIVLPGLFDMHGHVSRWEGGLHLAAGVTSVRDMGNDNASTQKLIDDADAGNLLAPQVITSGFLEGESPYSARNGFVIKTLGEARAAIDWYAKHGYPQLKIYNSFPRELLPDTVAYAHERGLRVSGHVPVFMRASEVVEYGFDELQHINQLMLNFLVTPDTDTRTLARFYLPAEKVADLDLDSKPVQDFIAALKARNVVVDPTLATFDFLQQRDGEIGAPFRAVVDHLPPDQQRARRVGAMKIPDTKTAERYRRSYAKMVEFAGRLHRAGVPLVAGTDEIAGFTLQGELELYVQAGLRPAEVLQIATRNGARYSRVEADRGRIAVGQRADLVLVDGDPLQNIADIRKVAAVISRGTLLYPAEIHRALGIKPFVSNAPALEKLPLIPVAQHGSAQPAGMAHGARLSGHRH